ncbi:unnamed protein product [Spirodela intermedia]|uniref:histidine kinase n=1 Tax=Spirodela intermedia TaxID=51605 RepID=A0A7I8JG44_SPIIN|nr:unnamed protein product [Spirodela intermedia]CAA6669124.1 unnamed protein product [Spirodela intermedia]
MKYQYISDFFIALAYFSIPLELIYFVKNAFIVLCGATHLINLWTVTPHSETLARVMTVAKVSTAFISCATALLLVHIIPELLSVKMRELLLKMKAEELDRLMRIIQVREEKERHFRILNQEVRASLDSHTIVTTAMIGLVNTLGLEECALWTPSPASSELHLSHTVCHHSMVGSAVPLNLPALDNVLSSNRATKIPHTSPLARIRPVPGRGRYVPPEVAAVKVHLPMLAGRRSYAVMVLMLPPDSAMKWRDHDLELVQVVADQVSAALAHAAVLEESMRVRDQLMEQNLALDLSRREAERAIGARNNFLAHRMVIETVLKSSSLMATLLHDALDTARLEDGNLLLEADVFNLPSLFREVIGLIKPIAAVKKLSVSLTLAPDLPPWAVGDSKRLTLIIMNLAGNAVKFTKEGYVSVAASVARTDSLKEARPPESFPRSGDGNFYLRVQVKDSGCGISPQELPHLFKKFAHSHTGAGRNSGGGGGLGLALCKRFVNLMGGQIWLESEGLRKGCTAVFVVKLGLCDNDNHPSFRKGSVAPPGRPPGGRRRHLPF